MTEPKRWLEQGAPRDIEYLVRAARAERPDEASLRRSLAAVGVGIGASSVAMGAKAAGAAGSVGAHAKATLPILSSVIAKWAGLGAMVGLVAVGAAELARETPRTARPPARPVSSPAPPRKRSPPSAPPLASSFTPRLVAPTPAPASPAPARSAENPASVEPHRIGPDATSVDADTLAEEVKSVDRARAALVAGQAAQTLLVLDDYERSFPQRGFAPESLYLRMEAYSSLGRMAEARSAAQRLLSSYPNSLHGARARALLSKNP